MERYIVDKGPDSRVPYHTNWRTENKILWHSPSPPRWRETEADDRNPQHPAATAAAVAASPTKRARMIADAPAGLARVAEDAMAERRENPAAASAAVVARVAKRVAAEDDRNLRGAAAAAKAGAKR